jgi:hypothetical protein
MTAGRLTSIASVLAVGVLGAGFAAWSGLTGPQVAGVQLRSAAQNSAASSFVAIVDATESVTGTDEVITTQDTTVREAPDRATQIRSGEVTGIDNDYSFRLTLTQVGNSCWTTERPPGEHPLECQMSRIRPMPPPLADTETGVTVEAGTYSLSPAASESIITSQISGPVGMSSIQYRISGSYLSWERVSFNVSVSGADLEILETLRFSHYGDVPPIATPPGRPTATAPPSES